GAWYRIVATLFVYAVVFLSVQWVVQLLAPSGIAVWHPPAGVHLTLLLIAGVAYAVTIPPMIILGGMLFGIFPHTPLIVQLIIAIIVAGWYAGITLMLRWLHFDSRLCKFRDVLLFTVVGLLAPMLIGAVIATIQWEFGLLPARQWSITAFTWWLSYALGLLTVAPVFLAVIVPGVTAIKQHKEQGKPLWRRASGRVLLEIVAWLLISIGLLWLVLVSPEARHYHIFYLLLLPIMWAALRAGVVGAASGIFLLNHGIVITVWITGLIIFSAIDLQLFILTICITGLVLGAMVTEQRHSEILRRQSEKRYHLLFDNMNEAVSVNAMQYSADGIAVDWVITDVNPEFFRVFNLPRERVIGKSAHEIFSNNGLLGQLPELAQMLNNRRPRNFEYHSELYDKDLLVSAFVVENALFALLSTDITRIRELERARYRFLDIISHELRTPLTNIIGWLGLIEQADEDKRQHAVEVVQRNADELRNKLAILIDIARLFHHALPLEYKNVDVWEVMRKTLDVRRAQLEGQNRHITIIPPEIALIVRGDPARLRQVFGVLLDNAGDFTGPGDEITVCGRRDDHDAVLQVQDTGRGMSSEQLAMLFSPFTQIERREETGGMGIGLVLAKGIVELHGGQITAESAGIGHGMLPFVFISLLYQT
ncbi:MAG TPA: MASE1 domain-containing protein, partial [Armatimonadota bacterium]|nr:MASE1 domain-containing protein [Armatimonadota bacterium]